MIYAINKETKQHVADPTLQFQEEMSSDWHMVAADKDGFINSNGGDCPINENQAVDYRRRDGSVGHVRRAKDVKGWHWVNFPNRDIVAYRPVLEDEHETSGIEQAISDLNHPYHELADVLEQAFQQAASGKGKERHANDLPFTEQRMQTIARGQGHNGGLIYQVSKKAMESERLPRDAALRELLGAIVYAAGAFIYRKDQDDE